jgi:hypothetical protein
MSAAREVGDVRSPRRERSEVRVPVEDDDRQRLRDLVERVALDEARVDDGSGLDVDRPRADSVGLREELALAPDLRDDEEPEPWGVTRLERREERPHRLD